MSTVKTCIDAHVLGVLIISSDLNVSVQCPCFVEILVIHSVASYFQNEDE